MEVPCSSSKASPVACNACVRAWVHYDPKEALNWGAVPGEMGRVVGPLPGTGTAGEDAYKP